VRLDTLNAITNKLKDAGSASDLHLVEVDTIMTVMESQQRKTQQTVEKNLKTTKSIIA